MVTFGVPRISVWVLCLSLFSDDSDGTFRLGTLASWLLETAVSRERKADATDGLAMTQTELAGPLGGLSKQNVSIWVWRKDCPHDTILPDGNRNHLPPWLLTPPQCIQSFEVTVILPQTELVICPVAVPNLRCKLVCFFRSLPHHIYPDGLKNICEDQ